MPRPRPSPPSVVGTGNFLQGAEITDRQRMRFGRSDNLVALERDQIAANGVQRDAEVIGEDLLAHPHFDRMSVDRPRLLRQTAQEPRQFLAAFGMNLSVG